MEKKSAPLKKRQAVEPQKGGKKGAPAKAAQRTVHKRGSEEEQRLKDRVDDDPNDEGLLYDGRRQYLQQDDLRPRPIGNSGRSCDDSDDEHNEAPLPQAEEADDYDDEMEDNQGDDGQESEDFEDEMGQEYEDDGEGEEEGNGPQLGSSYQQAVSSDDDDGYDDLSD